ncbi:MAG TPA: ABC transporter substrate-binding protein [Thermomicrobiales bacterium]|jgi:peptide/nickel transport system substrate-binding protein|nr:ABC transporter substrate-binding protein [Thermomicrobiales bacterium]
MSNHESRERGQFHDLLTRAISGELNRREVMARAAALGLSAASVFTLGAAAVPAPAAAQETTPEPTPGGVLRVGLLGDPAQLDPHITQLTAAIHVTEHIYEGLYVEGPDLSIGPWLAADMPAISEDGLTYTITLREGVTWHPPVSRPMTAQDVVYSFQRMQDPATGSNSSSLLETLTSVEAPDDRTVVMTLASPNASFLATLANRYLAIVPQEFVEQNGGDLNLVCCGTGPFVFEEYIPNTSLTVTRNAEYWDGDLPYLDGIEFIPIPTDTQRRDAIITDTVDFIEYAPLSDLEQLRGESSLKIAGDINTNIRFIGINLRRQPFDDIRVRQAINLALNRSEILEPATFGNGTATEVIFPEGNWAHFDAPETTQDIERAKALLAEAGQSELSLEILSWAAYSFLSQPSYVVQSQLEAIGISSEVVLEENATYIDRYLLSGQYDFDITVTGTSGFLDPHEVFADNFLTGSSGNASGYSNPEVDDLIRQGNSVTDQAERATIYQRIQEILLQDLPWINLFIANQYEAMATTVNGYTHFPTGSLLSLRETFISAE